jgi:integrase
VGVRIRQKDGKWYVFMNHQGTRKAKCVGTDKRLALQVQKQLEAKLTLGDVGLLKEESQSILFRDYAQQWLDTYATRALKPSSRRVARSIITNHLAPATWPPCSVTVPGTTPIFSRWLAPAGAKGKP